MANGHEATWELVLRAAQRLKTRGHSLFKLSELIPELQRDDPTRRRTSIQPVIQAMTENASGGPPSPCGKVFLRVDRAWFTPSRSS